MEVTRAGYDSPSHGFTLEPILMYKTPSIFRCETCARAHTYVLEASTVVGNLAHRKI